MITLFSIQVVIAILFIVSTQMVFIYSKWIFFDHRYFNILMFNSGLAIH